MRPARAAPGRPDSRRRRRDRVADEPAAVEAAARGAGKSATIRTLGPTDGRPTRAAAAPTGKLQLIQPLALSTTAGKLGESMWATARLKNVGSAPLQMAFLAAAGRGPSIPNWDCGVLSWDNCGADFGNLENLTLAPGEEYAYNEARIPPRRGDYWAELVYQDAVTGEWHGPVNTKRVHYTVAGGELQVVQPLRLEPANPRPGQVVAATARVRNVGELPVDARYLLAAGRGPGCSDWSCADENDTLIADFVAAQDVIIPPGGEYTYRGLTGGRRDGTYFAEMAYRHAGTELWRVGLAGSNRATYSTACDGRCIAIGQAYADVLGRLPSADEQRTAYDSPFDAAQLRAYLCGLPDRKPSACGESTAPTSPLRSILNFLPAIPRTAGR